MKVFGVQDYFFFHLGMRFTRIKCVGIIDGDALAGREPKAGGQILYSCGSPRRDDDFFDVYPVFCSAGAAIEIERCAVKIHGNPPQKNCFSHYRAAGGKRKGQGINFL